MTAARRLGHAIGAAQDRWAARFPRIAVGVRWIAKGIFWVIVYVVGMALLAGAFAVVRELAVGQDPQLVRLREYVLGAVGLVLAVLELVPGYVWLGLVIAVLLFLVVQELGHICSHLGVLNRSVGEYLEARRKAIEEAEREAKIRHLSEKYGVPEDRLRDPSTPLFHVLQDPYLSEEHKHLSVMLHNLPASREGEGQGSEGDPSGPKGK